MPEVTPDLPYAKPPKRVDVIVAFDLDTILDGIEALNDAADDLILGDESGCSLSDISYQVVGGNCKGNEYIGGDVLLRIQADVDSFDEETDDDVIEEKDRKNDLYGPEYR